ncbi:flavoprotein [Parageobacillus toebii]|nr:flavoprotein [Parageobacillus toebii]
MNMEEIINMIVEEVLKKLQERMKKATVLFTGGALGFKEAIQQLKLLLDDGWDFNILLSNSAEHVLTPHVIKKELGISNLFVEKEVNGIRPFYENINVLIIPTLTLNTAAKISVGIADSMATNLVAHAIMKGIPIVAAKDACDLQTPMRKQLGFHRIPSAYLENMNKHLQTIESYGIKLVNAGDLYQSVKNIAFSFLHEEKERNQPMKTKNIKKNVLTRMDIIEAKNNGHALIVPKTTIISPLALETAKELGVDIIQDR